MSKPVSGLPVGVEVLGNGELQGEGRKRWVSGVWEGDGGGWTYGRGAVLSGWIVVAIVGCDASSSSSSSSKCESSSGGSSRQRHFHHRGTTW